MAIDVADLVLVGGVLLQAGILIARVAALTAAARRLERGAHAQGERIENLTTRLAVLEDRSGASLPRRRPSMTLPAGPDESGET